MPKYSNSSLVTYKKLSPMCSSRIIDSNPTGKIDTITIHHMAGNLSIEACRSEERRVGKGCRSRWAPCR